MAYVYCLGRCTADADFWDPKREIEAGVISVHVGGGQPEFYAGSLSATVTITSSALLDNC